MTGGGQPVPGPATPLTPVPDEQSTVSDVVGAVTRPVREVLRVFELGPVSIVLIALSVVFGASAIWARSVAPHIFEAPEFLGLLGFAGLLAILGWSERLVTLRGGPKLVDAISVAEDRRANESVTYPVHGAS